jgi:predicted amidohydrolase
MRVAAVQMRTSDDRSENLGRAAVLVTDAASQRATFVVLPELFASLGRMRVMRDNAETLDGPTITWARELARSTSCTLLVGSFVERDGDAVHNTGCLIGPDGGIITTYRKIHMFDVDLEGAHINESDTFTPGDDPVVADVDGIRVGLTICYDLRFPEVFRIEALRGAQVIATPAAFTETTGRDHWELLLRARAVENQVAVVAAATWGTSPEGVERHGHALIVDAWGRVLADAGHDGDSVIVADIDLATQADIRRRLPSLTNRRPAAYRWPD